MGRDDGVEQAVDREKAFQAKPGVVGIADPQRAAIVEPCDDLAAVDVTAVDLEDLADGGADQITSDRRGATLFAFIFQLELAGDRRQRRVDVADPRDGAALASQQAAALGVGDDVLDDGNRQPLADARAAIDALIAARLESDLLDGALDEIGYQDR